MRRGIPRARFAAAASAALLLALIPVGPALAATNGPAAIAAAAGNYPTWAEVQAAVAAQNDAQALIDRITKQIAQLTADADAAQADADAKALAWQTAQDALDEQTLRTQDLQAQAADAAKQAADARAKTNGVVSELARSSGGDLTLRLVTDASSATSLLDALSRSSKLAQTLNGLYAEAARLSNTAVSLQKEAEAAQVVLTRMRDAAQAAASAAQAAAALAQQKVLEQQDNQNRMQAQLVVLTQRRQATEADYAEGERIRKEEEARAAAAAAAAAAAQMGVSGQGWARPANGYVTSGFGWRIPPTAGASSYHGGIDFGIGCGSSIYAAASGTVTFAAYGYNGGNGNYIVVDHGGGVETTYSHIQAGGIQVRIGDHVSAGQRIASAGATGVSIGCHLHFVVRTGGAAIDPAPWLRSHGVGV